MDTIPYEIWNEILSLLPVKSYVAFISTCKYAHGRDVDEVWNALCNRDFYDDGNKYIYSQNHLKKWTEDFGYGDAINIYTCLLRTPFQNFIKRRSELFGKLKENLSIWARTYHSPRRKDINRFEEELTEIGTSDVMKDCGVDKKTAEIVCELTDEYFSGLSDHIDKIRAEIVYENILRSNFGALQSFVKDSTFAKGFDLARENRVVTKEMFKKLCEEGIFELMVESRFYRETWWCIIVKLINETTDEEFRNLLHEYMKKYIDNITAYLKGKYSGI